MSSLLDWIALACLAGAVFLLIALSLTDLRTRLLPNEMVLGLATLGIVFHLTTMAAFVPVSDILLGGIVGFASLFGIRAIANHFYKTDALGLGDVKLMGAGGIWLGPYGIMLAMSAGAIAGLLHGLYEALRIAKETGTKPDFTYLQIPAGPGFAAGIFLTALYLFRDFNPFGG